MSFQEQAQDGKEMSPAKLSSVPVVILKSLMAVLFLPVSYAAGPAGPVPTMPFLSADPKPNVMPWIHTANRVQHWWPSEETRRGVPWIRKISVHASGGRINWPA